MMIKNYLAFEGHTLDFNGMPLYFPVALANTGNDEFFYPHVCAVYRSDGSTDEVGNEILTGVYYGDCAYDLNTNGGMRLLGFSMQADAVVIVPETSTAFRVSDSIDIEVENGRFVSGIIEQIETVKDADLTGTTFWIKNAQG